MDRISALRNVEDALSAFEAEEISLPELEREVRGILRTYATEFDPERRTYRASGDAPADGLVVIAESRAAARDQVGTIVGQDVRFEVEPVEE